MLRFCAKGDLLVTRPGFRPLVGQSPVYVGRRHVRDGKMGSFPATDKPFEVDATTDVAVRLAKLARRDRSLWAYDKETAQHCGIDFVPVEYVDGEWVPAKPKARGNKE